MKSLILVLSALAPIVFGILSGCTKELGFDLPYDGDKLVLYGVLSPDSVVSLRVSRTYPPTGRYNYGRWVTNARVQLYEDSLLVEELSHLANGRYVSPSNFTPQPGRSYYFTVSSSGMPDSYSLPEQVPERIKIGQYAFAEPIEAQVNAGVTARKLDCRFTDSPATTDYYAVRLSGYSRGFFVAINSFGLDRPDEYGDGCGFRSAGQLNEYNLSDVCFSGQPTTVRVGVELEGPVQPGGLRGKLDQLRVSLIRANRGYFEYNRTFNANEGFLQAFQPPQVRYSNVKGGYGIILSYSSDTVTIRIE
ncbi:DUF4249 domain-containing protein [Rudanella lutea]|uniref:DUF4249 domain-containing protein n=1 Tax=Rudanella lutea TaxID=451374 RepID=UPI00036FC718|nr:DUF4249 domain-containing protein [Rudanella lutea]